MSAETIFVGWERSLAIAKQLGHEYLVVPDFEIGQAHARRLARVGRQVQRAGAVARRAGIWLAFHNESYHQKPIDGKVPTTPSSTGSIRQSPGSNSTSQHGDRRRRPMQYLQKYPDDSGFSISRTPSRIAPAIRVWAPASSIQALSRRRALALQQAVLRGGRDSER